MGCDICGKTNVSLNQLRDIYKTEEIVDVCDGCESIINKQQSKIRSVTHNILVGLLKSFIKQLKASK